MKKRSILCLLLVLSVLSVCLLFVRADFGDFAGDADYGGGDWGGDYGGDYGGWDDDYGYRDSDSDDFDPDDPVSIGTVLLVVVILIFVFRSQGKKYKQQTASPRNARPEGGQSTDVSTLTPMSSYPELDPAFDEDAFCEKLSNLYVQMQNGWQNRNIETLRPFFTDAYFNQMLAQLDRLKQDGITNRVERIAVLSVKPLGYKQANGVDHIIVELRTRITDYTVRDSDGSVVSGNPNGQLFMTYEWDLCRVSGQKTEPHEGMRVVTCPNCGASVDINASAKCPYCDSVITVTANDWAICKITGISRMGG